MSMERTPRGKAGAMTAAAAMGQRAFVARGRATATTTLSALALWCVAMATALGTTETTVVRSRETWHGMRTTFDNCILL